MSTPSHRPKPRMKDSDRESLARIRAAQLVLREHIRALDRHIAALQRRY